jgi:hypothetical protein
MRYLPELPDQPIVVEVAAGRIPGPRERDGAGMTRLAGKSLRPHHRGVGIQAFRRLADGQTVVGENERQSDIVGHFGHLVILAFARPWPDGLTMWAKALP